MTSLGNLSCCSYYLLFALTHASFSGSSLPYLKPWRNCRQGETWLRWRSTENLRIPLQCLCYSPLHGLDLSELWQIAWIIPALWSLLSYTLLLVICVLWAHKKYGKEVDIFQDLDVLDTWFSRYLQTRHHMKKR
ncbi:uncharacterized protein LOC131656194 [Vicia villosa]|uniref:uncharacterized protein LOC131599302 n=1 Tax=Vicia villosa TaxID=3911 RepID=UPI00273AA235|nr:uncharacterized protein LOC131599302 [Vicia villosa]XP_058781938.1 uncharacterized protein LOC131656194 [Vicia villosa]